MSVCRFVVSLPAVLFACALGSAGLGGCYDLSTNGPRPEDFESPPGTSEPAKTEERLATPASPTALDRGDVVVKALAAPTPPADEAARALLPNRKATEPTP